MSSQRKTIIGCFLIMVIGIFFMSLSPVPCLAQAKYTVRVSTGLPENHFMFKQYKEWATLAQERSKGAMKVEIYPSGQLFKDDEVLRAVQMGAVEVGAPYSFNVAKTIPEFLIFQVPFLLATSEDQQRVLVHSEIWDMLVAKADKKNLKVLAGLPWPMEAQGLISKKLLKTPADAKGTIIRLLGVPEERLAKSWGAAGTYITGAELYVGLQRGTINGAFSSAPTWYERKLYEAAPNFTVVPYGAVESVVIMNKDYYNKLPAELQQIILATWKEVEGRSVRKAAESYQEAVEGLKGKGATLYIPTKEQWEMWRKASDAATKSIIKDIPNGAELVRKVERLKASK
jgi:TRAP-type C4-dicarboxylate transport system substrate-binding protein